MPSCGLSRRVALVICDISEERIATIIKVILVTQLLLVLALTVIFGFDSGSGQ
jgi:hypothetical protein